MGRVFPSHDLLGRIGRLRSGPGEIGGGVKGFPKTYIIMFGRKLHGPAEKLILLMSSLHPWTGLSILQAR